MLERLKAKPKPPAIIPFPIHIAPDTTWRTLPQRIAEGIVVALVIAAVSVIGRLIIQRRQSR